MKKVTKKATNKNVVPIASVIQPLMKLRAKLDRIINLTLRKEMGFGASLFRIMMALTMRPGITQKEISDFWDVTEASVSRQVSILERRGWVTRKPTMVITPLGTTALAKARGTMEGVFEKIFKNISDKKRKATTALIEELINSI